MSRTDTGVDAPAQDTCGTCRFSFLGVQGDPLHGLCRRYPPAYQDGAGVWPEIVADDWCGEFASLACARERSTGT